jgi:hypothetical protein
LQARQFSPHLIDTHVSPARNDKIAATGAKPPAINSIIIFYIREACPHEGSSASTPSAFQEQKHAE